MKIILPIVVIALATALAGMLIANKPPPAKVEVHRAVQSVTVMEAKRSDVKLSLPSQGMIAAKRVTVVSPEVAGRVAKVSEKFKVGENFSAGEVLIEIDPADYQTAVVAAEAVLADANLALENEKAKAAQAARDWAKLAAGDKPSALVLRKPQLESAAAHVKAAEAGLLKARRDLARTKVTAPFTGRLRTTLTELGAYVAPSAKVAEIYSTEGYELRLPLSLDDFAFVDAGKGKPPVKVQLYFTFGGKELRWDAKVVRVDGEVERSSRSVSLVAEFEVTDQSAAILKPGLFVQAEVEGVLMRNVFRVPRRAFLDEKHVLLVDAESKLRFREVKIVRADGPDLLVEAGLEDGEQICLTIIAAPVDGMEVSILSREPGPTGRPL